MTLSLLSDIKLLTGISTKKAEVLYKEAEIQTINDLIRYYPFKHIDRSQFYKLADIHSKLPYIQVKGKITIMRVEGDGAKMRLIANFTDGTDTIELLWFKGLTYIKQNLKIGVEYVVFGKPTIFKSEINIVHPEIELLARHTEKLTTQLEPAYPTSERMKRSYLNSKAMQTLIQNAFRQVHKLIGETLPPTIIDKCKLIPLQQALLAIHFPKNTLDLQKAEYRLKFEELFFIQLKLLHKRGVRKVQFKGLVFSKVGDYFNNFYTKNLKYELTGAQKRVIKELRRDFGSGKHTNRLLQGDVGSGKTLVALMSMLLALDNGYQACLMAPTEILANQHFQTIVEFLEGLNIEIDLLTGSTGKKKRRSIHERLIAGQLQILIGTHALIEDEVKFNNLALVIIDEQHRFGVAQRAKLWAKNSQPPHIVVMTATPIPRTLAMTLYGDLDISIIDELPPGRKAVQTMHAYDSQRLRIFAFLKKQIALGRQIYIVYPLIQESENFDYKDLEDGVESISRAFPPPQYALSVVHGKMKSAEKDKAMQLFVKGLTHIMVATTVIEVGVNVPNASVMLIESAERFGLSQLHQLRGRVGRGAEQSYCILMTSVKLSAESRKRIKTMVDSNDGFEIAEADMKLRGPGDIDGTQQSGLPINLRIANLANDGKILTHARSIAEEIIESDPMLEKPEHEILKTELANMAKDKRLWRIIS